MVHSLVPSILSVLFISIAPLSMLKVYSESDPHPWLLLMCLSLAVGCLCGDAIFHLLPEALGIEADRGSTMTLLALFTGLFLFFLGEQYMQLYHCGHDHVAGHSEADDDIAAHSQEREHQHEHEHQHQHQHQHQDRVHRTGAGSLVIISDAIHNIVDGLAIGASFRSSFSTGLSTALAVLLHELPHELGDYAILLREQYTVRQVAAYSLAASASSVVGALIGSTVGDFTLLGVGVQRHLLGFTAGNFFYIALADLVPELLHGRSKSAGWWRNTGVLFGAMIMLLLKLFTH